MMCMLEDEGTMMAVQECIASSGASMRSATHDLIFNIYKY